MGLSSVSGLIGQWVDPDHSDMNAFTITQALGNPNVGSTRVRTTGTALAIHGVRESEFEYTPAMSTSDYLMVHPYSTTSYSSTDSAVGNCVAKIMVLGAVASSSFWVETITHCEFTGGPASHAGIMGEADSVGFAIVSSAANRARMANTGASQSPGAWAKLFSDSINYVASHTTASGVASAVRIGVSAIRAARQPLGPVLAWTQA